MTKKHPAAAAGDDSSIRSSRHSSRVFLAASSAKSATKSLFRHGSTKSSPSPDNPPIASHHPNSSGSTGYLRPPSITATAATAESDSSSPNGFSLSAVSIPEMASDTSPLHPTISVSSARADSLEDTLEYSKIITVARNGDQDAIARVLNGLDPAISTSKRLSVLHTAAQCATTKTVKYILSFYTPEHPELDVNARDGSGDTALHLASRLGRREVVAALLERPDINDVITNRDGATPLDLAGSNEVQNVLSEYRVAFSKLSERRIHEFVRNHQLAELKELLQNPRVPASVDLNSVTLATSPDTVKHSGTLLHEAARNGDKELIQILLEANADPSRRDRKGKRPVDLAKKGSVQSLFTNHLSVSGRDSDGMSGHWAAGLVSPDREESREMRGYLSKWTNFKDRYKRRWFVLENGVLSYYEDQKDTDSACRGAINMRIARCKPVLKGDGTRFDVYGEKASIVYYLKAHTQQEAQKWVWVINAAIRWAKDQDIQQKKQVDAITASADKDNFDSTSIKSSHRKRAADLPAAVPETIAETDSTQEGGPDYVDDAYDSDLEDDASSTSDEQAAMRNHFALTSQAVRLELDSLYKITRMLEDYTKANPSVPVAQSAFAKALPAYTGSISSLRDHIDSLERISADSERGWQMQLKLWEESVSKYALEHEEMQAQVRQVESKRKMQKKALKDVLAERSIARASTTESVPKVAAAEADPATAEPAIVEPAEIDPSLLEDSDDEDSFFDAVEDNQMSVVDLAQPEKSEVSPESALSSSFVGYEDPIRTSLDINSDDRPKISLWGILKSMIGKDMTKMTLPVSFNEPTSLLYRVAEDMEYADLINAAVNEPDSTKRMLYVVAFAASEYASTIGRIAKPFNPLLGETFEYARPDKGYRFFVEQVSHHPPVSAAYAESASWEYWGESKVDSKFYGRTFDINPLGTWFLRIKPKSGGPTELYTWKKVTSSVVGIITGSPKIENYGDMRIVNHQSGEVGEINFAQSGMWKSADCQVTGRVLNSAGESVWSIGGRWDSKIHAKATGSGADSSVLLVWKANERPKGIPFNLTPFVVTFNALPDALKPYLAPTDSRFRPDQRAMEQAKYDVAAEEKNRVEELQRKHRREREAKKEAYEPKWFSKARCETTGEEYWNFSGDYWKVREQVVEGKKKWDECGLEPIYNDPPQ